MGLCFGTRGKLDQIDGTLQLLTETRVVLSAKIGLLDGRCEALRQEAKADLLRKCRQLALTKLRRSKLFQHQNQQAGNYLLQIDQIYNHIESGLMTLAIANTMRQAADTITALNERINVREVESMLDALRENILELEEATDAIGRQELAPMQFNEEDLERELAALSEDVPEAPLVMPGVPTSPPLADSRQARGPIAI